MMLLIHVVVVLWCSIEHTGYNVCICGVGTGVSLSLVSEVVGDNLGTVMSVLESVWGLLLGNLSLAISALTAVASLLLGGSLSILNALISVVSLTEPYCFITLSY